MAGDWKTTLLSSVIDVKHGFAFSGDHIRDEPPGNILLTPGNFAVGGGFKGEKFKYFDGEIPEEFVLDEGDLLVTMTDLSKQADTLGYPAFVPKSRGPRFLHNQRLGKILIKSNAELDARFLFYLFRTAEYRHEILASATGTTVKHTSPSRILAHKAPIPDLSKQQSISAVLGAFDDKIELNRQMNETLEALAQTLFKNWFVDAASTKLPKGWREGTLGEVSANASESFNFSKFDEVVFVNTGDVLSGDFLHSNRRSKIGLPGQAKKAIRQNDILFSEIRPANRRFAFVDFNPAEYVVSTKFMVIRANEKIEPRLLYRVLKSDETLAKFQLEAESRSGTFPQITFDSISRFPIVVPPKEHQQKIVDEIAPLDARIKLNKEESRTLAELRDTLLPKLLSGELRVPISDKSK